MINKTNNLDHYSLLSGLLDYPDEGYVENAKNTQLFLNQHYPEIAIILNPFIEFISTTDLEDIRELHTRSFEVQAITTLDLGYLLFGDDYKRAELLVNLSREHRETGNDCGTELADYLPNVFRLIPKLEDKDLVNDLINKLIYPGLEKMVKEFNPENLKSKNEVYKRHHKTLIYLSDQHGTIFQKPLMVLLEIIQEDFEIESSSSDDKSSDFLQSINTEMKIED